MPAAADPFVAAGTRRHRVTVQNPGPQVPNGDGGYTNTPIVSPIPWAVAITPATGRDLENIAAGTTTATIPHIVTGPYRADITSHTALIFNGRVLNVAAVRNPEERNISIVCVCVEVEAAPAPPTRAAIAVPTMWRPT